MSPQTEIVNKMRNRGSSSRKGRNPNTTTVSLKRRGRPEIAEKTTGGASSETLSLEEIKASMTRLEAEMAERKPQRGSSKILKKRLAAVQRLRQGGADLRGRIFLEAEHQKKKLKALEEEKQEIALKRAMNEEEEEEIKAINQWLNPLLSIALLGHPIQEESQEPVFAGGLEI